MTKHADRFNARIQRLNQKAAQNPKTNNPQNCKGLKHIVNLNKISSSGTQKQVVSVK